MRRQGRIRAAALAWLCAALVAGPTPARAELAAEEIELKVTIEERADQTVQKLRAWVERNTGTYNTAGLEQFAPLVAAELRGLGFEVKLEKGPELELPGREPVATGPIVIARRAAGEAHEAPPRLLLSGHYDTVFEPDHPFQKFTLDEDDPDLARGPGVADMKGGILVMLEALRALERSGDLERAHWAVILNADEELGSLGSRPTLEALAREADAGFVFEAAQARGAMVRSRRGLGQFHLSVQGVAAHAGSAHEMGRSAVRELAEKILLIEAITDYNRGVTLNVGTISGGTKRNVVPARAEAWVDLRYDDAATGREVRSQLEEIAGQVLTAGTSTTLWGTLHRPPKPATAATDALLDAHRDTATDLGLALPEPVHAGGGTDGSILAAAGLPTLDSLGVVGEGAHTKHEAARLGSLVERAAVAAILWRRMLRSGALRSPDGKLE